MSGTSALGALLRVGLSLAVIAAMVWLAGRIALRRGAVRPSGAGMTVVARRSLGRRASLVVVEAGGRQLLVGVTEQQVSLVAELDRPERLPEPSMEPTIEVAEGEPIDLRPHRGPGTGGIVASLRELTVRRAQGSGP